MSAPSSGKSALTEAMAGDKSALSTDSARATYAQALLDLIASGRPVVAVEADLMKSAGTAPVQDRHPDRLFDVGIAEQNSVGMAAGLADMGLIPFVDTFAVLLSRRCADQVWMAVCFSNKNVKLNGLYSGFTTGTNGPTHQSLEDIAILRSFPNMRILEPADCKELREAVFLAAETYGPFYIRNVRGDLPPSLPGNEAPLALGKAVTLRPGGDAAIVASGVMVPYALRAAEQLAAQGMEARVINARSLKPLDEETVVQAARETGAVVTVENHGVTGGLGGAVAEVLGEQCPTPMRRIGVRDRFGDAGDFGWLLQKYGMDVPDIVAAVKGLLASKGSTRSS